MRLQFLSFYHTENPDVATNVTITGSGYVSIPLVTFQNTSTGARVTATTVTFTSSTSLVAKFPSRPNGCHI